MAAPQVWTGHCGVQQAFVHIYVQLSTIFVLMVALSQPPILYIVSAHPPRPSIRRGRGGYPYFTNQPDLLRPGFCASLGTLVTPTKPELPWERTMITVSGGMPPPTLIDRSAVLMLPS